VVTNGNRQLALYNTDIILYSRLHPSIALNNRHVSLFTRFVHYLYYFIQKFINIYERKTIRTRIENSKENMKTIFGNTKNIWQHGTVEIIDYFLYFRAVFCLKQQALEEVNLIDGFELKTRCLA
jgi:hypothetical protein